MKKLLAFLAMSVAAPTLAVGPVGTAFSPVTAFWRVPDHYKLPSDGLDDAPSVQRAIDASCAASPVWGEGGEIRLLARQYQWLSQIVLKDCRVTISGTGWQEAPDPAGARDGSSPNVAAIRAAKGTWIVIGAPFKGKSARADAPIFITQSAPNDVRTKGTIIRDIAFSEPDMACPVAGSSSWTPDVYPPVIGAISVGGYIALDNLYYHGVYSGVDAYNVGRLQINRMFGQFFKRALAMDQVMDVSRVRDIHAWPFWSGAASVIAYQQAQTDGIVLGRTDSPLLDDIFVFAANSGIKFTPGAEGAYTQRALFGKLVCDSVRHCISNTAKGTTASFAQIVAFGQQGVSSGHPLDGANVLQLSRAGTFQIGHVNAGLMDDTIVNSADTTGCSSVRIDQLYADFRGSDSTRVSLFKAVPCSASGATGQLFIGIPPAVLAAPGQTFTNHANSGGKVFYPSPTEQP